MRKCQIYFNMFATNTQNILYTSKISSMTWNQNVWNLSWNIFYKSPFFIRKYLSHGRIQNVQYLQHLYCFCSKVNISSKSKYRQIDCFSAPFLYFHVVNHSIDVREHKKYRNNKITFAIEGYFRSGEIVKLPSTCNINN